MTCPYCNSENVVCNVTIRWNQIRGVFVPRRGHYCTTCGKSFDPSPEDGLSLSAVVLEEITPAIRKLQESGDVIVVRHRDGLHEVVY
jgi:transposase-like protein